MERAAGYRILEAETGNRISGSGPGLAVRSDSPFSVGVRTIRASVTRQPDGHLQLLSQARGPVETAILC